MTYLIDLLNNQLLFWSLIACLTAQLMKIIFNVFSKRELRFGIIFETGGMPSSHSSLITGVASGVGLEQGFDSPAFAISVCISLIVMYDASGIRRAAGLQANQINKISKEINLDTENKLKETLGHSKLEVIVGALIGPLVTISGIEFLGSPNQIFSLFIK